jgi:NAD(P)-dependent dehydrogenase (short-subunit alcohol dehydrogenase family)
MKNKNVVIVGGSRGLGRTIAGAAHAEGACVLAVARQAAPLAALGEELPGAMTLVADATHEDAPGKVFATLWPDVLVLCGGALPPTAPVHEQTWEEFSRNWNADVKASFLFCRAALSLPLSPGATVILISSGAAIGGSAISGGFAGAKRMQMFLADYCQSESERLNLGLRFFALAPMRIMPDTDLGKIAVDGYARRLGIPAKEFIKNMEAPQTPQDVAGALITIATDPGEGTGNVFVVSGKGVERLP